MRAAIITKAGGPEVLAIEDRPSPTPGVDELGVRVEASAINRADLIQCRGFYPAPPGVPADIPGLEFAGVVEAVGALCTGWSVGDRVMGIVGGGACADQLVIHHRQALRAPVGLSFTDLAAIPEAFVTAFDAAVVQGGLRSGGVLAVNAVASGVGTALVQIAHAMGATSVGSSRTESKLAAVVALGLDHPVCGDSTALMDAARAACPDGVDVAVDLVGGEGINDLIKTLKSQGAVILVGLLAGRKATVDLARVLRGRVRIQGTALRSRPVEQKIDIAQRFNAEMAFRFEGPNPTLRPVVDRVLKLSEIADAHRLLGTNTTTGKIVLDHRG